MSTKNPDYKKIIEEIKQEKRQYGGGRLTRSGLASGPGFPVKGPAVEVKMKCPVCGGPVILDKILNEYVCTNCGIVIDKTTFPVTEGKDEASFKEEPPLVEVPGGEAGIRIAFSKAEPGAGHRLILTQRQVFNDWKAFFNPVTDKYEMRKIMDVLHDASLPEALYQLYMFNSSGLPARDRAIVLLGVAGGSLPTTAITEVTGMTKYTGRRVLSPSEGFFSSVKKQPIKDAALKGSVLFEGKPFRVGAVNESYRVLTKQGLDRYNEILAGRLMVKEPSFIPEPTITAEKSKLEEPRVVLAGKSGVMMQRRVPTVTFPLALQEEERDWFIDKPWRFEDLNALKAKIAEKFPPASREFNREVAENLWRIKQIHAGKSTWIPSKLLPTIYDVKFSEEHERSRALTLASCTHETTLRLPGTDTEVCMICGRRI